ncbi:MAG: cation diffusion facilitator family transporter, partial [Methylomonas sp.]
AWERLDNPQPLQQLNIGVAVSVCAAFINLILAKILIKVGKQRNSIPLEADGYHLMTDVWTTIGVISGITLIAIGNHIPACLEMAQRLGMRGWEILDPIIAFLVAINIIWSGLRLLRRTVSGLMDAALPAEERNSIINILEKFRKSDEIAYHALRTRYAGARRFMSVHILVPGHWTVQQGHDLVEKIELSIISLYANIDIDTHLEPIEDLASWRH